ncbi:putative cytochrome-c oxidase [Dioscorea sansibarensis]
MFVWWRDVLRESTLEGHHTKAVQLGPRYGSILFIVSEVMFFFCFFLGFFSFFFGTYGRDRRYLAPKRIGAAVTWAHHAILAGKEKRAVYALVASGSLALVSTGFQGMEYYQAPSTSSDSIYVLLFLDHMWYSPYLGHLTKEHHVGFEAAAWYWHFVDVVRLFPFVSIYWWGGI